MMSPEAPIKTRVPELNIKAILQREGIMSSLLNLFVTIQHGDVIHISSGYSSVSN